MKILIITGHDIDLNLMKNSDSYNGRGWIESLISALSNVSQIEPTVVLLSNTKKDDCTINGVNYTTIWQKEKSAIQKLFYYYRHKYNRQQIYDNELVLIIKKYKPDIIHVFGLENTLAYTVLNQSSVPAIIHLQGLLSPIDNAFYPAGFNRYSFFLPITIREWILRNGFIHAKNNIEQKAKLESELYKKLLYVMGRTHWDRLIINLLAQNGKYFQVDEILRSDFYKFAGKWEYQQKQKITIISTLSETIYKGLDLILKTANLLFEHTNLQFEWNIIGLNKTDRMVKFFEKNMNIKSEKINISYIGIKNSEEICSILLKSDVYVHPSYIDNSPNSICEAQLIGLPVIATNVGGVSTLVEHYNTGILVPANAPYELSYYIRLLYQNIDLNGRLSANAKEIANRRHDKMRIISELTACYSYIYNQSKK